MDSTNRSRRVAMNMYRHFSNWHKIGSKFWLIEEFNYFKAKVKDCKSSFDFQKTVNNFLN